MARDLGSNSLFAMSQALRALASSCKAPTTLAGMETCVPATPTRQFILSLGNGRFMHANFTLVEIGRHAPTCLTPTTPEITRTLAALSAARLLP